MILHKHIIIKIPLEKILSLNIKKLSQLDQEHMEKFIKQ